MAAMKLLKKSQEQDAGGGGGGGGGGAPAPAGAAATRDPDPAAAKEKKKRAPPRPKRKADRPPKAMAAVGAKVHLNDKGTWYAGYEVTAVHTGTRTMDLKKYGREVKGVARDDVLIDAAEAAAKRGEVGAYGAAAKGATLLNHAGIGGERLRWVADRSPHKQGLRMPGPGLPVVPPERLLADQPDYVVILAWNFAEEIMDQQADYRAAGGRFIVPVPAPRVIP